MALIECPECGKMISDCAEQCPNCGCPKSDIMKLIFERKRDILQKQGQLASVLRLEQEERERLEKERLEEIKNKSHTVFDDYMLPTDFFLFNNPIP
jgi:primosomal protein N'